MKFNPGTIRPLLRWLAEKTGAITIDVLAVDGAIPLVSWGSTGSAGVPALKVTAIRNAFRGLTSKVVARDDGTSEATVHGYELIAAPVLHGDFQGSLCVVRESDQPWSSDDRAAAAMTAQMCSVVIEAGGIDSSHGLDSLVTYVASELMGVQATDMSETTQRILGEIGRYFNADHVCIRRNDLDLKASVLVEEWPRRELPGPDPLGVIPWDIDNSIFSMLGDLRQSIIMRPGEKYRDYQELIKTGAGVYDVSLAAVPLIRGDDTLGVLGLNHFTDREWTHSEVGALEAISALFVQLDQRITAEVKLHHQAYHDELTGLWNRRAFVEHLNALLAADPHRSLAVLFADMDRLKTVNDVLGHSIGDTFIHAVADRLRESVRPHDLVARLAGDEFVIVLQDVESVEAAKRAARRILDRVVEPLDVGGHQISRSASIGLSVNTGEVNTVDELLGNADVALLEAKERGGDSIVAFNDDLHSKLLVRADLELRLRTAISNDEMRLYYQPEFDLRDGRMTAAEALVRWQHPERGLLAADSFISVLEEINLAAELGRWVLDEACRQLSVWKASSEQTPPVVRVNISAGELISADFVGFVKSTLERYRLAPEELGIEITESSVMRELDDVQATLNGLRELGVRLAIDDFGTGYSSFAQLKQLPVDILKIDRSFVSSLAENNADRAIVAAIVRLAEAFNLTTVAEGVEEAAAVTSLLDLGCTHAQGFYMSKPLPPHAVLARANDPGVPLGAA